MEQTNPESGVVQEAPGTMEHAVQQLMHSEEQAGAQQAAEPEQPQQQEAQGQADEGEPSPDDIPDEEAPAEQPAAETVFEIVHAGKTHTIADRAEQIRLMQQGFDYTQKTQALSAKDRTVGEQLQRLAQVDQVVPQLQNQLAQVKALETQLQAFQGVNWVAEAQADPSRYAQLRAQFDVLRDTYGQAVSAYQRMDGAVKQQLQHVAAQRLQAEAQRLPELVPEWKDTAKLEGAKQAISKHFAEAYGIDPAELNANADTAVKVAVLYKAMKYDQLVKSKADKSKTLRKVPPVTVPGAAQPASTTKGEKLKQAEQRLRKNGTMEDAVAVLLNR